ncbi:hypothetical protein BFR57_08170 [Idiomarina sp. MD25a]|uniref:hypothetical protein n=1 Tax=Idiomarina sp. MD25a TaxID=1889913 RepID=UPI0008F85962|nr:hypothetical protein [Idiomarina sp. MD25a]OIN02017.1 hypothetical protein BFR57_08170 [Idiomarina sp. MD25a]
MAGEQLNVSDQRLQQGEKRLNLIGRHAAILMQAYQTGVLDELSVNEGVLRNLLHARIIYQPESGQGYRLRAPVAQLIANLVVDERRRSIQADVADKLEAIRGQVDAFRKAQQRSDIYLAELKLQVIEERVHDLVAEFDEAIHSLWNRLNTDFGFAAHLDEKMAENQRAQNQIERLLEGLSMIDYDECIALADGHVKLRHLLVVQLQRRTSLQRASMLEIQHRMIELMSRFREQQSRSLLVGNMAQFLRQHPELKVSDYTEQSQVPTLFNQARAIRAAAHADVQSSGGQRETLAALHDALQQTRHLRNEKATLRESAQAVEQFGDAILETQQRQLKHDVDQFFIDVAQSQQPQSALDYLIKHELQWHGEIWLFQVLSEYQTLARNVQAQLPLQRQERPVSTTNNVQIIEDLVVTPPKRVA